MSATVLNAFISALFNNYHIIGKVHTFDEVRDYGVQGVEIRLKDMSLNHSNFKTTSEEDEYMRPDPFQRNINGYVYLCLGYESSYKKWWEMMIDGRVSQTLINKYPGIIRGEDYDRDAMESDRKLFTIELKEKFNY